MLIRHISVSRMANRRVACVGKLDGRPQIIALTRVVGDFEPLNGVWQGWKCFSAEAMKPFARIQR